MKNMLFFPFQHFILDQVSDLLLLMFPRQFVYYTLYMALVIYELDMYRLLGTPLASTDCNQSSKIRALHSHYYSFPNILKCYT
jgi:hypothetical protein